MAASSILPAAPASARDVPKPKRPATSQNGWTIQANADLDSQVWTRTVASTGLSVPVWIGDVEAILLHTIRRFHYEIEEIRPNDLVGWTLAKKIRKRSPESNLASGTRGADPAWRSCEGRLLSLAGANAAGCPRRLGRPGALGRRRP